MSSTFLSKFTPRLCALYGFGLLMIIWNILGHTVLGFEQSYAVVLTAVGTALVLHPLGLLLASWVDGRPTPWQLDEPSKPPRPTWRRITDEIPAAIIPGFACGMLLAPNSRLWPVVFAVAISFASKTLFRYPNPRPRFPGETQHMFNPSNFGIVVTLMLLPSVGLAPPYQFTANVGGMGDYIIPSIILVAGCTIHFLWARRWLVVFSWFAGFALQAMVRGAIGWSNGPDHSVEKLFIAMSVPFWPYTGAGFILFSFFMIPDPATTPNGRVQQVIFGLCVATLYGIFQYNGIVYGFFWGLIITCAVRGLWIKTRLGSAPAAMAASRPVPDRAGPEASATSVPGLAA